MQARITYFIFFTKLRFMNAESLIHSFFTLLSLTVGKTLVIQIVTEYRKLKIYRTGDASVNTFRV